MLACIDFDLCKETTSIKRPWPLFRGGHYRQLSLYVCASVSRLPCSFTRLTRVCWLCGHPVPLSHKLRLPLLPSHLRARGNGHTSLRTGDCSHPSAEGDRNRSHCLSISGGVHRFPLSGEAPWNLVTHVTQWSGDD